MIQAIHAVRLAASHAEGYPAKGIWQSTTGPPRS